MPLQYCIADLPMVYGAPLLNARLKFCVEDFCVNEEMGFECSGEGEHVWVFARKSGISTTEAAAILARAAGVKISALSWSGLKDKQGVCRQWFSIHSPGKALDGLKSMRNDALVIEKELRNHRKLRRGSHRSNHFRIRLRNLTPVSGICDMQCGLADLSMRIDGIQAGGVPNYFGEQRFGYSNLEHAAEFFRGIRKPGGRTERGMWLSAARSAIFNAVLAQRVGDQSWNQYLSGDVMNLDGSASVFVSEQGDSTLHDRLAAMDIHPTGPMWGMGTLMTTDRVGQLETDTARCMELFSQGVMRFGMQQERRSLRLPVKALNYTRFAAPSPVGHETESVSIELNFSLPPGSYATAVLRELFCYDTSATNPASSGNA